MESLPEIVVVISSTSELLASPLNITIQQKGKEVNNSSSNSQDPMEVIPVDQFDHIKRQISKTKVPIYNC